MARIRSVHPGLFTDEAFVELSPEAQVFFIGLWTEADDQGLFEWKPITLKMKLRPASTTPVEPLLAELEALNFVRGFQSAGKKYGAIRNFRKYQRPKFPKATHTLPPGLAGYVGLAAGVSEIGGDEAGTATEIHGDDDVAATEIAGDEVSSIPPSTEIKADDGPPFPRNAEIAPQMEDGAKDGAKEKKERDSVDDDFSTWYAAYPLHKGRGQALRAYRTARKKTDARILLAGATRYAADSGRDPRYTKHPATWLNGECWADDAAGPIADPLAIPPFLRREQPNGAAGPTYMGRPTPLRDGHPIRVEHQHLASFADYDGLWVDSWDERKPASVDEARTRMAALEPSIWPDGGTAETQPEPTEA